MGDVFAGEPDRASGRRFETDDQLEQSALAGPVGADDGQNLAIVGLHSYPVDGSEAPKMLDDLIQLE
jgi:hypothetical protein